MRIELDDLTHPQVIALLQEHLQDMFATSPPESVHALDIGALKAPNIRFFTAWQEDILIGCLAIKHINADLVELKSMRTSSNARGQGVASKLLQHVLDYTKTSGFKQVSLETGVQEYFAPARNLYRKFGFVDCGPFCDYTNDPNSHYMTLYL